MEEEIWKDIKGYEGLYQVSNKGNVKSLNYKRSGKDKILKLVKQKNNYIKIQLYKDRISKQFFVHRLVAETFIDNPDNLLCVNHKDENPSNNFVENLEFCTHKYNSNYGTSKERIAEKLSIPIKCLDLQTNEITYYSSIHEAGRKINIPFSTIWTSIFKCKKAYKNRYLFSEI